MAFKLPKKFSPGYSTSQKPTIPVEIDWSNPMADGLVSCVINGIDLAQDIVTEKVGVTQFPDGSEGVVTFFGTRTDVYYEKLNDPTKNTSQLSVFVRSKPGGLGHYFSAQVNTFASNRATSNNRGWTYGTHGALAGSPNPGRQAFTISGVSEYQSSFYLLNGASYQTHGCTAKSGDTVKFFTDGVISETIGIGNFTESAVDLYLGVSGDSLGNESYSKHSIVLIYNRIISADEIALLDKNPYQILKPSIDTIYFSDAVESTGGIDINVPKSDINLTSFQPVVNISQHITAEIPQHDLNLLSHIPSVDIGANIDVIAPQHNISINSYPPSVVTSESIDLDIPLHNININSHAPIAVASNFIDAEIPDHNININSHAPVISLGAIIENIIPAHNINITGYAPDIAISEHINSIIPEHDISLISYAPEVLANSSVNAIIPNNDIQIESHIPRVLIAGAFTTAKERIYGYPAINRIYTMTRR